MDMTLVVLKFKKNSDGTQFTAYCDEYPQVTGSGPTEGHATNSFWKAFNSTQAKEDQLSAQRKKAMATAEVDDKNKNKKKKAA